ncbi:hypothetical protein NRK67_16255 [Fusobacteria bacterium ZRK30]|nr:hypothetical protein NRK67_16255 [Fusobacteria bacterium ZRK30]
MKKLIINANVFDGKNEELQRNVSILIENNLITKITHEDISKTEGHLKRGKCYNTNIKSIKM